MRDLSLRAQDVDCCCLPLASLARLEVECTRLVSLAALGGATGLTHLDLTLWAGASSARHDATALLGLPRLASLCLTTHGLDARLFAGLTRLTRLTSLTLCAAPGFDRPLALPPDCSLHCGCLFGGGCWRGGGGHGPARPGPAAQPAFPPLHPSLPPLRTVFTRVTLHPVVGTYAALTTLELKDVASPRFDASVLARCPRLRSLDVSFAADSGQVEGLEGLAALRTLKTGCPALRLVLPRARGRGGEECVGRAQATGGPRAPLRVPGLHAAPAPPPPPPHPPPPTPPTPQPCT